MNMKKLSVAAVVMLGLGISAAQADDGTLSFSGSVAAGACSIDAGSKALAITYDALPIATLDKAPDTGMTLPELQKPFSIKLSGCPEGVSSAKVMFDGQTSGIRTDVFVGPGTSRYVGAQIIDVDTQTIIVPKTLDDAANTKTIVAGNNTLNYMVGLTKTSVSNAVEGTIDIPITYTIQYQ